MGERWTASEILEHRPRISRETAIGWLRSHHFHLWEFLADTELADGPSFDGADILEWLGY